MSEHDPGPWTIEEYGDDDVPTLVIHKDTESRICFMATPGSHGDSAIIEANARLIAAAPDLLAALIALRHECIEAGFGSARDYRWPKVMEDSAAAIAKATGVPVSSALRDAK